MSEIKNMCYLGMDDKV